MRRVDPIAFLLICLVLFLVGVLSGCGGGGDDDAGCVLALGHAADAANGGGAISGGDVVQTREACK